MTQAMTRYIIDRSDMLDYALDRMEVSMTTGVVEARMVHKKDSIPPIRVILRFAPIAFGITVPTIVCWSESSCADVAYTVGMAAETLISARLSPLAVPLLGIRSIKGGKKHAIRSVCHGN